MLHSQTTYPSMTKQFAVIGHPISHSKSPQLHQAGFQEFNIDAQFEAVDVSPENLGPFIKKIVPNSFEGVAVTIPHKETVLPYLDMVTEAASEIGAVNTLYKKEGKLCGTNTDGLGALRALETITKLEGKRVLILGAGGASRAIIYALKKSGADILIYNRTFSKAEKIAKHFEVLALESFEDIIPENFDIIINTTSVGLNELKSPLPADFWLPQHIGFDIVYTPLQTQFLEDCEKAGGQTITGDKMLVHQALAQFQIWHEQDLEPAIMEQAFFE